jgi:hypothetical protein
LTQIGFQNASHWSHHKLASAEWARLTNNISHTPFGGGGVLGVVHNVFSLHTD